MLKPSVDAVDKQRISFSHDAALGITLGF